MFIFVIALLVFGPDRLTGMARQAGRYINQLRRMTQDARSEIQSLTRDLDIREDLNSVKADLLSIRDDLTTTATGISKDFENIRKDLTLRDESGNTMGEQREQYTYQVKDTPAADGSEAVVIEETIQRETIIQDALENTPAVATEVLSATTSSEETPAPDSAVVSSEAKDPALRVIRPARPVDAPAPETERAELAATETVVVESGAVAPPVAPVSSNPFAEPFAETVEEAAPVAEAVEETPKTVANPFGTPFPDAQPIENFLVPVNGTGEAAPEARSEEAAQYAMAANGNREWEESLEKTRQEFNERIDKMESQFMERLERVEKLLASQFVRAHQEQGG